VGVTDGEGHAQRDFAGLLVLSGGTPCHDDQVIRSMFGLTKVEAMIVKLLSDGIPPNEAARRLRVSPHTLRGYMKVIFAKLGVHRQSDLVRMITSRAGLIRVPPGDIANQITLTVNA